MRWPDQHRRASSGVPLRILILLAKVAVTVGLLSYVLIQVDVSAALSQVQKSNPVILVAGTLLLAVLPLLGALRWRVILLCFGFPWHYSAIARWTYISVFFSQVLPATVGADALRIWLAHRAGLPIKEAVNSVALDRALMFFALAVLLAVAASELGDFADIAQLRYLAPLLLVGTVIILIGMTLGDRLPKRLQHLRGIRAAGYLARDARRLFLSLRFGVATVLLSAASYLVIIVSVYLSAVAFGATFGLSQLAVLLPPVLVASSLPVSIGGWGTREMAMVVALGTVGTSPHIATLVSLWLGLSSILISVPGAILYLTGKVSLKQPIDADVRRGP